MLKVTNTEVFGWMAAIKHAENVVGMIRLMCVKNAGIWS